MRRLGQIPGQTREARATFGKKTKGSGPPKLDKPVKVRATHNFSFQGVRYKEGDLITINPGPHGRYEVTAARKRRDVWTGSTIRNLAQHGHIEGGIGAIGEFTRLSGVKLFTPTITAILIEQGQHSMFRSQFLIEMSLDPQKVAILAKKRNQSQQWASGYLAGLEAAKQGDQFAGLGQAEWRSTDEFAKGYKEGWNKGSYQANLPALRA